MAAFDFPGSPVNGQTYTANGVTYVYSTADGTWTGGPVYDSALYQPRDVNLTALGNLADNAVGFPEFDGAGGAPVTPKVTIAEFRGGTVTPRLLGNKTVWDAAAEVTVAYTASWTPDMATFINAVMTLTGALTIGNPSNAVLGRSGAIALIVAADQVLSFGTQWYFGAGAKPALAAIGESILYYYVRSGKIHATFVGPYTNA